jgi:hypothetical protein
LERAYKIEGMYDIPELSVNRSALSKSNSNANARDTKSKSVIHVHEKLEARYELYLTPDWGIGKKADKEGEYTKFGMTKHTQWFYFSTKNFAKNLKVTFAIKNFYK